MATKKKAAKKAIDFDTMNEFKEALRGTWADVPEQEPAVVLPELEPEQERAMNYLGPEPVKLPPPEECSTCMHFASSASPFGKGVCGHHSLESLHSGLSRQDQMQPFSLVQGSIALVNTGYSCDEYQAR